MRAALIVFASLVSRCLIAQVNVDSSLSACYSLNGNALDIINNLNGTTNNVTATVDRFNVNNNAFFFPGNVLNYIELPDNALLKSNAVSFSAWIKPAQLIYTRGYIVFTKSSGGPNYQAYSLTVEELTAGRRLRVTKGNNGNIVTVDNTTTINLNTWYYVCFTMNNSSISIYVNGVLENTINTTMTFDYLSGKKVYLGHTLEVNSYQPFSGVIDNVRFYNRILTAAEVNQLYTVDPACITPTQPPVASFSIASAALCVGQSVTFVDLSTNYPTSWLWQIPGATANNTFTNNPVFTFTTAGNYTASLTSSNNIGASNTYTQALTVYTPPIVTAAASPTITCKNKPFTLTATGAATYTWSSGQTGASVVTSTLSNTTYTVIGTNTNGCNGSATRQVKIVSDCWNSISESTGESIEVDLFPNPSSGKFLLESASKISWFSVYDFAGTIVIEQDYINSIQNTIDLSAYPKGIYFLKISSDKRSKTLKLVLE